MAEGEGEEDDTEDGKGEEVDMEEKDGHPSRCVSLPSLHPHHTIPHPHLGSYDCGGEQAGPAGVSDIVDCVVYCMHRVCVHLINVK